MFYLSLEQQKLESLALNQDILDAKENEIERLRVENLKLKQEKCSDEYLTCPQRNINYAVSSS